MRLKNFVLAICSSVSLFACSVSGSPVGVASQPSLTGPTTIPPTIGFGDPGTVVTLDAQGNTNWVGGAWYVPLPVSAGDVIGTVTAAVRDNGQNNGHSTDGNNVLAYLVSRTSTGDTTRAFWSSNGSGSPQTATLSPSGGYAVKAGEEMLVEFAGLKGGAVPGPSTVPSMTGPVAAIPVLTQHVTTTIIAAASGAPLSPSLTAWHLENPGMQVVMAGGALGRWYIPIPLTVGHIMTGVRIRVRDSSSGPTIVRASIAKESDGTQTDLSGPSSSSGFGSYQTLTLLSAITAESGYVYYARIDTPSGSDDVLLQSLEFDSAS